MKTSLRKGYEKELANREPIPNPMCDWLKDSLKRPHQIHQQFKTLTQNRVNRTGTFFSASGLVKSLRRNKASLFCRISRCFGPMSNTHDLGPAADLASGQGRAYEVEGETIAVFRNAEGTLHAIDDTCPHAGASLAEGDLEDGCVTCPLHAWRFELATGECPEFDVSVKTFLVKEEGDRLLLER